MLTSEMERMELPNIKPCQRLLTLKLNTEEKQGQADIVCSDKFEMPARVFT